MTRPQSMKSWALREANADKPALLIRNARVLDPVSDHDDIADVLVCDSTIAAFGKNLDTPPLAQEFDAAGQWLMPGLVDLCARFREPGQTHKANFASETRAAQAGGITEVLIPPDTQPIIDTPAMMIRMNRIAGLNPGVDVRYLCAQTLGLNGDALAELSALKSAGAVGASNGLRPVHDGLIARRALEYAKGLGLTTHVFAQDPSLAAGGCAHEGPIATRLGLSAIPDAAEVAALRFWISLVEDTGARVHFCRLSTARGVDLMASAQARGLPVTADVAMHQLFLTEQDIDGFNALCHVAPPLRAAEDRDALRDGVRRGVIAAICSDHQPHDADAKINPFPMTEPGVSALETMVPLALALVDDGVLTPLQAVDRLCSGPAAIAGTGAGRITQGAVANLTLIDPDVTYSLDPKRWISAGKHSPFADRRVRGRVERTIHRGIEVFRVPTDAPKRSSRKRVV